jgi:hypothetical protein
MDECTPLEMAVKYLKDKGIIVRDGDVARDLKMSKGTLSAYITGKTKLSKNFTDRFENQYKLKISDFEGRERNNNHAVGDPRDTKIINLLETENERLKKEVDANFVSLREILQEISARVAENQMLLSALMGTDQGGEEDLDVKPYKKSNRDQKKKGNPN